MARSNRHHHSKVLRNKPKATHRLVDRLVYFAAIIEPLFSLPQAIQIYHDRTAGSVSILTWLGFETMTLIWLWYGVVHREKMILIYQGLFFIIDGSVLIGTIYYGGKLL